MESRDEDSKLELTTSLFWNTALAAGAYAMIDHAVKSTTDHHLHELLGINSPPSANTSIETLELAGFYLSHLRIMYQNIIKEHLL